MSLLLLEGFDDGLWESRTAGTMTTAGVSSSYGLHGNGARFGNENNLTLQIANAGSGNRYAMGFSLYIEDATGGGNAEREICGFAFRYAYLRYDSGTNSLMWQNYTGSSWNYFNTATNSVSVGEWHYVEMDILFSTASAGIIKIWIDGTLHVDESSVDMDAMDYDYVQFGEASDDSIWNAYIDDIYVTDTNGTVNTANLGPIEVETLLPDGNGASSVLVGSDANSTDNYLLVDNNAATPPATTEYVGSDTEGDKDTYTMGDLTGTPTVAGMIVSLYAAKTAAGAKYMRPVVRTASTDYPGDSEGLAESYTLHEHVWDENPNTTAAWTYTDVNGMEIGQEVRDS